MVSQMLQDFKVESDHLGVLCIEELSLKLS